MAAENFFRKLEDNRAMNMKVIKDDLYIHATCEDMKTPISTVTFLS